MIHRIALQALFTLIAGCERPPEKVENTIPAPEPVAIDLENGNRLEFFEHAKLSKTGLQLHPRKRFKFQGQIQAPCDEVMNVLLKFQVTKNSSKWIDADSFVIPSSKFECKDGTITCKAQIQTPQYFPNCKYRLIIEVIKKDRKIDKIAEYTNLTIKKID
ncbi:hypothetical protein SH668x_001547 [Planctomicrobium sp. SH668]|uniref:hypothetical protein n=1 Tax=Planctomicrobium sp. SH668 TaxID=3448126 RepID=UPI003F5B773B